MIHFDLMAAVLHSRVPALAWLGGGLVWLLLMRAWREKPWIFPLWLPQAVLALVFSILAVVSLVVMLQQSARGGSDAGFRSLGALFQLRCYAPFLLVLLLSILHRPRGAGLHRPAVIASLVAYPLLAASAYVIIDRAHTWHLRLRVADARGEPVKGAEVTYGFFPVESWDRVLTRRVQDRVLLTDAAGRVDLPLWPEVHVDVEVSREDGESAGLTLDLDRAGRRPGRRWQLHESWGGPVGRTRSIHHRVTRGFDEGRDQEVTVYLMPLERFVMNPRLQEIEEQFQREPEAAIAACGATGRPSPLLLWHLDELERALREGRLERLQIPHDLKSLAERLERSTRGIQRMLKKGRAGPRERELLRGLFTLAGRDPSPDVDSLEQARELGDWLAACSTRLDGLEKEATSLHRQQWEAQRGQPSGGR